MRTIGVVAAYLKAEAFAPPRPSHTCSTETGYADRMVRKLRPVEFESLSWGHNGGAPGKPPPARPDTSLTSVYLSLARESVRPTRRSLRASDVRSSSKENVREALGLRRETAFLQRPLQSLAPWLVTKIPTRPSSAMDRHFHRRFLYRTPSRPGVQRRGCLGTSGRQRETNLPLGAPAPTTDMAGYTGP